MQKHKIEKRLRSGLNLSLRLLLLTMLPMLGTGCAALSGMKNPVDAGQFPPCVQVTQDEVTSIRDLTKYDDPKLQMPNDEKHKPVRELLIKRDQSVLNVLGRMSTWCKAYHARIGYVELPEAPAATPEKK